MNDPIVPISPNEEDLVVKSGSLQYEWAGRPNTWTKALVTLYGDGSIIVSDRALTRGSKRAAMTIPAGGYTVREPKTRRKAPHEHSFRIDIIYGSIRDPGKFLFRSGTEPPATTPETKFILAAIGDNAKEEKVKWIDAINSVAHRAVAGLGGRARVTNVDPVVTSWGGSRRRMSKSSRKRKTSRKRKATKRNNTKKKSKKKRKKTRRAKSRR